MNPILISLVLTANVYYEVHGQGQPLVLLHGGGSSFDTFSKLIPLLAKNHQVIAFDQRGHGRTPDNDRPFSFEESADDAAALLKELKIPRADFYGFSNGGTIALQVALRHPEVVRRLVIVSGMSRRDGATPEFWEGMKHATLEGMPPPLRETYVKVAPHPEALRSFFEKSVQRMLTFKDFDVRGIQAPALIIIGDRDVVRPEHALELQRTLPRAQLAVLPNTDHGAMLERAEWQVPMIEEFLK
jgi:pimeloyl-ACP methyl ester carboxylesterase